MFMGAVNLWWELGAVSCYSRPYSDLVCVVKLNVVWDNTRFRLTLKGILNYTYIYVNTHIYM